MRKVLVVVLLLTVAALYAKPLTHKSTLVSDPHITGAVLPVPVPNALDPMIPYDGAPVRNPLESVGRDVDYNVGVGSATIIGETYWDYQGHGTLGKMIAVDPDGGIHITWMKGSDPQMATRHMAYNGRSPEGVWASDDYHNTSLVDASTKAGYGHLALIPTAIEGFAGWKAMGIFHASPDGQTTSSAVIVDVIPCLGAFEGMNYLASWDITDGLLWPKGAVGKNLKTHVLGYESPTDQKQMWARLAYWRGTPTDVEYQNWNFTAPALEVGITSVKGAEVSASLVSNKVVMAWHENRIGRPTPEWETGLGVWQRNNDIRYVVLPEGEQFDPEIHQVKSLTKIAPPPLDLWVDEPNSLFDPLNPNDPDDAYGDVWRPYCDLDIQFDPWDDNLFSAFSTIGMWERPIVNADGEMFDGMTSEHNMIWFWNSEKDTITLAANGWYFNRTDNFLHGGFKSRCGFYRGNNDRPSIAFDPDHPGHIYMTYVSFPKIMDFVDNKWVYLDGAADTCKAGFNSAEVMVTISTDYGITWREPVNITNTRWTGNVVPEPGEGRSESWQTVASVADGSLHVMYIADSDAGGRPQMEGQPTNSPVVYQNVPLDLFRLDTLKALPLPYDGFMFHNAQSARPEIVGTPQRLPAVPSPADEVVVSVDVLATVDAPIQEVVLDYYVVDESGDSILQADPNAQHVVMVKGAMNGDTATYSASIPATADGKSVWYKIIATNSIDRASSYPGGLNNYLSYTVRPEGDLTIRDIQYKSRDWNNDLSPYCGIEVTVTGIVTTPQSYNEQFGAYAIQDGQNYFSGVLVRGINDDLAEGDKITVTGTVREQDPGQKDKWEYNTYIEAKSHSVVSTGNQVPEPVVLATKSTLYSGGAENWEGMLVHLWDLTVPDTAGKSADIKRGLVPIIDNETPIGKNAWIHNLGLSWIDLITLDWDRIGTGSIMEFVAGILTENYGHYAVGPRDIRDIPEITFISVEEEQAVNPRYFELHSVHPNPFNSSTTITFNLRKAGRVTLDIVDINGRLVTRLADNVRGAGMQSVVWDAGSVPAGIYLVRLTDNDGATIVRKAVVVK